MSNHLKILVSIGLVQVYKPDGLDSRSTQSGGFFYFMTYSQKLKDPRWQKKRLEIMQRDDFTCTLCKDSTSTLSIHHEKYKGDPWDVDAANLRTVCEHCHDMIHDFDGELPMKVVYPLSDNTERFKVAYFKSGINIRSNFLNVLLSLDQVNFIKNNY